MGLNPPRGGFGEREAPDGLTQWRPIPDFRIGLSKPQPVRQFAEPAFSIDYARQASALEFPPLCLPGPRTGLPSRSRSRARLRFQLRRGSLLPCFAAGEDWWPLLDSNQ